MRASITGRSTGLHNEIVGALAEGVDDGFAIVVGARP